MQPTIPPGSRSGGPHPSLSPSVSSGTQSPSRSDDGIYSGWAVIRSEDQHLRDAEKIRRLQVALRESAQALRESAQAYRLMDEENVFLRGQLEEQRAELDRLRQPLEYSITSQTSLLHEGLRQKIERISELEQVIVTLKAQQPVQGNDAGRLEIVAAELLQERQRSHQLSAQLAATVQENKDLKGLHVVQEASLQVVERRLRETEQHHHLSELQLAKHREELREAGALIDELHEALERKESTIAAFQGREQQVSLTHAQEVATLENQNAILSGELAEARASLAAAREQFRDRVDL